MERNVAEFFDATTYEKAEELIAFITTETPFSVKDAGAESHNIQYWMKQGLLPDKSNSWAIKMNFVEFVWLKILSEARAFGMSSESLKEVYEHLTKPLDNYALYAKLAENPSFISEMNLQEVDKDKLRAYVKSGKWKQEAKKKTSLSVLLLLIAETISKRSFVSIALFTDGEYAPLVEDTTHILPAETQLKLKTQTHLTISITNILNEFLGEKRFASIIPQLHYFSEAEIKLLEQIRSGKYDEIKIRFSNKRMDFIELQKHADTHKKIVEILSENKFQSISISTQHGKVSRIVQSVKMKV